MTWTKIGQRGWLGNPFTVEKFGREESIERFRDYFEEQIENNEELREAVADLQGKTLGCWCQHLDEDEPACHAEVIAEWADRLASNEANDGSEENTDRDINYVIQRLEEAIDVQQNTEGEIATTPTVAYCFDCDEIAVDTALPDGCLDHKTVSSDGYEHGGIQSAITALRAVHETATRGESDGE